MLKQLAFELFLVAFESFEAQKGHWSMALAMSASLQADLITLSSLANGGHWQLALECLRMAQSEADVILSHGCNGFEA